MGEDENLIMYPPKKYAQLNIVTGYWMDFANQSSREDFKKESAENAERARGLTLRYMKSAKGYAQLEQDIIASLGSNVTSIPKNEVWRAIRVNKNDIIDDEEVHRVVKLTQTFPQEQLQAMGKDDILSRALGVPEHPDRVRAAGFGVSQRSIFGPSQSTPQQQCTDWKLRAQHWMMQISRGQVPPFMSMPGQPPFVPMPGQPATRRAYARPTSLRSYAKPITLHVRSSHIPMGMVHLSHIQIYHHKAKKGDHPCFLFLNSPCYRVARGTMYNKGGVTLHTMSLPSGHYKVSVDVVQSHEEDSPLPVPIEDENLMTLRDAIATYVAWPRSLINLPPWVPPPSSKGKGKEHFQTKESITSPMKGSVHRIIPKEFAGAEGILAFKNLRIMVQGDLLVHVVENIYSKDYWGRSSRTRLGRTRS
ncbi:hypothetical protein SESBI_00118 [Sesbania bispinosa]|nr:hypothetical protein SESBI_00118 [Sesbania bispinosa]